MMTEAARSALLFHFMTHVGFYPPPELIINLYLFSHFQLMKKMNKGERQSSYFACHSNDNLEPCKGCHMQV
jgi:hypothetical protein